MREQGSLSYRRMGERNLNGEDGDGSRSKTGPRSGIRLNNTLAFVWLLSARCKMAFVNTESLVNMPQSPWAVHRLGGPRLLYLFPFSYFHARSFVLTILITAQFRAVATTATSAAAAETRAAASRQVTTTIAMATRPLSQHTTTTTPIASRNLCTSSSTPHRRCQSMTIHSFPSSLAIHRRTLHRHSQNRPSLLAELRRRRHPHRPSFQAASLAAEGRRPFTRPTLVFTAFSCVVGLTLTT